MRKLIHPFVLGVPALAVALILVAGAWAEPTNGIIRKNREEGNASPKPSHLKGKKLGDDPRKGLNGAASSRKGLGDTKLGPKYEYSPRSFSINAEDSLKTPSESERQARKIAAAQATNQIVVASATNQIAGANATNRIAAAQATNQIANVGASATNQVADATNVVAEAGATNQVGDTEADVPAAGAPE